ncbi:uncharacterized protein EI90DRAFT_825034 [Cantharellus anzutake]|uniref:uncharacterized protein n=1 Tax=Cantharellus anzutake TaxID=1750568 RepID=UPI001904E962|nr:uncharacterized protein EI90DRAFT_825034 [Cantharellus anzutake]KAF8343063.1 hypothetical protein EI90DRAFT_825034 [Cantharellus anzutake]
MPLSDFFFFLVIKKQLTDLFPKVRMQPPRLTHVVVVVDSPVGLGKGGACVERGGGSIESRLASLRSYISFGQDDPLVSFRVCSRAQDRFAFRLFFYPSSLVQHNAPNARRTLMYDSFPVTLVCNMMYTKILQRAAGHLIVRIRIVSPCRIMAVSRQ